MTKLFELRLCSNGTYYVYENGTLTDIDFDKFNKESADTLVEEVNNLYDENEQLKKEIAHLKKEIVHLKKEIVHLENKLAYKDQHNTEKFRGIEDWARGGF